MQDRDAQVLGDIKQLAQMERPNWTARLDALRLSGTPLNAGDDDTGDKQPPADDKQLPADDKGDGKQTADEMVTLSKAEVDALRRVAAEAAKAQRKAETDARNAREAKQADEGKWEELANSLRAERDAANDRIAQADRNARIDRIAAQLRFRDPAGDVRHRLTPEEADSDELAAAALARIAAASPHLLAPAAEVTPEIGQVLTPAGVQPNGANGDAPVTAEYVKGLTAQDYATLPPERLAAVQKFLRENAQNTR